MSGSPATSPVFRSVPFSEGTRERQAVPCSDFWRPPATRSRFVARPRPGEAGSGACSRVAKKSDIDLAISTKATRIGIVRLEWLDATLNAAMILTGMGPVDPIRNAGGKIFASRSGPGEGFRRAAAADVHAA